MAITRGRYSLRVKSAISLNSYQNSKLFKGNGQTDRWTDRLMKGNPISPFRNYAVMGDKNECTSTKGSEYLIKGFFWNSTNFYMQL